MKTNTFLLILFSILGLVSCDDGHLSNTKAMELLNKSKSMDIIQSVKISTRWWLDHEPNGLAKKLVEMNWATIAYQPNGEGYDITLRPEVTPYNNGSRKEADGSISAELVLGKKIVANIISVQEFPALNTAEVKYVERIAEVNQIGQMDNFVNSSEFFHKRYKVGQTENKTAAFIKDNNGWRLEK